jgi:glutathione synthase
MPRIAVQMDALETLKADSDSSLAMIEEAQRRGYPCDYYVPSSLHRTKAGLYAYGRNVFFREEEGGLVWHEGEARRVALADYDVVLMRQDPPFDMEYVTYTYFLEELPSSVLVLNNPGAVRDFPEKLLATRFPEFTPPTVLTRHLGAATAFAREHEAVILKPLYDRAGQGIIKVDMREKEAERRVAEYLGTQDCPAVVQAFLPQVTTEGDRRVMMIDGEIAGTIVRLPAEGGYLANLAQGGRAVLRPMDAREYEACAALGPFLKEQGLFLAGVDLIGGYLTEVNVTSPTGFRQIAAMDNPGIVGMFWDRVEGRL